MTFQKESLIVNIKESSKKLANDESEYIQELTAKTATFLEKASDDLTRVNGRICEERITLTFINSMMESISGAAIIDVYEEIKVFGESLYIKTNI